MQQKRRDPLNKITFRCEACRYVFESAPDQIVDTPADDWHPWRYVANTCPSCGDSDVPEMPQQRHLRKMWSKATGPKTAEGKAASAKNIEGHPTREEAQRHRFNALKHGMYARTAKFFPARPGQYAQCEGCEYLIGCHRQIACLKRTELMLKHAVAFETKDPALLTEIRSDMQGGITALIDDIIYAVAKDGVRQIVPKTSLDKNGKVVVHEVPDRDSGEPTTINEIHSHPLLKVLGDFMTKNNLSLADLRMTPRVAEEEDVVQGQLLSQGQGREDLLGFAKRQAESLEGLSALIKASRSDAERDPILLEFNQGEAK